MYLISRSLLKSCGLVTLISIGAVLGGFVQHGSAMDSPDVVKLDSLVNLYEAVNFDHAMHVDAASCAVCHHHTLGTPPENENCARCHKNSGPTDEVACAGCHSANPCDTEILKSMKADSTLFHIDRAGLKRAYHQNCMSCHYEMDAPTSCDGCHRKRTRHESGSG